MKIAFTGDIAFSKYFKLAYENENLLSNEIIEFLSETDYTVANVEAPVTNGETSAIKPLVHVSHPRLAETLKKINANVWNLANNHSMDCGEQGLNDTLKLASEYGAVTIGAGKNLDLASKSLIVEKDGVKVGLISISSHFAVGATQNSAGCFYWDEFVLIKKRINEIKQNCDYCVVVVHGGEEFSQLPLPYARDKYKKYLKFGADIVVGHHPHVPQNFEKFGEKVIFYSLGNFIFDTDYQRLQNNTDKGILLKLDLKKDGFTFESLTVKINREKNCVEKGEPLKIFRNFTAKEYSKLLPLNDLGYSHNLLKKLIYLKKLKPNTSKFKFFITKLKRFEKGERLWLFTVPLRRLFTGVKVDGEIADYIRRDLCDLSGKGE